ncbi:nuclear transport factor 2 family protein [Oceaniglobus roseus]|uniref:nuclear transport factor 2 family protein n=1 Tax=Oceaniglobus roseus TaxID=1737570 RepID=UPI000C7F40E4|nr:nuclear transport factor 2 family protein [Kandeliimicrobium roseum]
MADHLTDFFRAWGESDPDAQGKALRAALAPGFTYVDPRVPGPIATEGELLDYVAAFTSGAPGWQARVLRHDAHHGFHRLLVGFGEGETIQMHGTYFARLDDLGRIETLAGFRGDGAAA